MDNRLFELADQLKRLREEKDTQAALLKDLNVEIDETEFKLSEAMAVAECSNFTRCGKQFILTTTTRWSAESDRKDELYAALRENGYDHLFTVNAQTLGAFVREQVEEYANASPGTGAIDDAHVPDWLAGLVKSYDDVGVTMKSATKKAK